MNKTDVPRTILHQLGSKALTMIGARDFMASGDMLQFRIGKNPKGVSKIQILLTSMDLYNVTYYRIRKFEATILHRSMGLYADQLHDDIEEHTGLYTSL